MHKTEGLQPQKVFSFFEDIAGIPHGSGNTKAISDYLVNFAKERDIKVRQDEYNNILMFAEASEGYEQAEPIIIQGHMDMVCEKESGCAIDFENDGLKLYVDGDFLKARGTTLGGDDGIAVAYALAILDSPEIKHPSLEIILTVDEEIGMLGAKAMDLSDVTGRRMLNIDSDVEGEFLTSCAGGATIKAVIPMSRQTQAGHLAIVRVDGLLGGHSGGEIDRERANAMIVLGRALDRLMKVTPFGILSMTGGGKDNAIPREASAQILLPDSRKEEAAAVIGELADILRKEYRASDPDICLSFEEVGDAQEDILDFASTGKVILLLRLLPNGVMHRSMEIEGLVETSLNLGILELRETELAATISTRSSVASRKQELQDRVIQIIEMLGGAADLSGDYPAWEYRADSALREKIREVYTRVTGKEPVFCAIHAGLECGILSEKLPGLDCVSFGPANYDIHTPNERLSISSVQRYWDFLTAFLEQAK